MLSMFWVVILCCVIKAYAWSTSWQSFCFLCKILTFLTVTFSDQIDTTDIWYEYQNCVSISAPYAIIFSTIWRWDTNSIKMTVETGSGENNYFYVANVIVFDLLIKNICIDSDLKQNVRYRMSNRFPGGHLGFFKDMNWVPP